MSHFKLRLSEAIRTLAGRTPGFMPSMTRLTRKFRFHSPKLGSPRTGQILFCQFAMLIFLRHFFFCNISGGIEQDKWIGKRFHKVSCKCSSCSMQWCIGRRCDVRKPSTKCFPWRDAAQQRAIVCLVIISWMHACPFLPLLRSIWGKVSLYWLQNGDGHEFLTEASDTVRRCAAHWLDERQKRPDFML